MVSILLFNTIQHIQHRKAHQRNQASRNRHWRYSHWRSHLHFTFVFDEALIVQQTWTLCQRLLIVNRCLQIVKPIPHFSDRCWISCNVPENEGSFQARLECDGLHYFLVSFKAISCLHEQSTSQYMQMQKTRRVLQKVRCRSHWSQVIQPEH